VATHDLLGEAKADAGAFLFGSKEWDKNLAQGFLFDAFASVADFQNDLARFVNKGSECNHFFL
jgi:hypothetical protein